MRQLVKTYNTQGLGWRLDLGDDRRLVSTTASFCLSCDDLERVLPHLAFNDSNIFNHLFADYKLRQDK